MQNPCSVTLASRYLLEELFSLCGTSVPRPQRRALLSSRQLGLEASRPGGLCLPAHEFPNLTRPNSMRKKN